MFIYAYQTTQSSYLGTRGSYQANRGSGVTTAPAMQGKGGGKLPNLLFFKRKIALLGSKMYHISVNLAISRREKNIWGYKKLQSGFFTHSDLSISICIAKVR